MSGSYPTSPGAVSMMVRLDQKVDQSVSHSGRVQTRVLSAQKTVVSLAYSPEARGDYAGLESFIMRQRGRDEFFTFAMPGKATPLGAVTGAPVVYEDYPAGTETIALSGMTPDVVNAFVAADLFNFTGYTLVHKVAFNEDSAGNNRCVFEDGDTCLLEDGDEELLEDANTVTLTFSPPLNKSLTKGAAINYQNVVYTMKAKTDTQSVKVSSNKTYMKQFELEEYLG